MHQQYSHFRACISVETGLFTKTKIRNPNIEIRNETRGIPPSYSGFVLQISDFEFPGLPA